MSMAEESVGEKLLTPADPSDVSLSREEAIGLLGHYLALAPPRWQNLQSFVAVFTTVNLALLGATVAAMSQFDEWGKNMILLAGPLTSAAIAHLAKRVIRSQDSHIRELIVMIAKLEEFLGLDHRRSPGGHAKEAKSTFWPEDTAFLPGAWIRPRLAHASSDEFVQSGVGGTAKASIRMFDLIQVLSAGLIVAIAVLPLL